MMSKRQHGNKEAKKPKKAPAPKPLAPAGSTPAETISVAPRIRK